MTAVPPLLLDTCVIFFMSEGVAMPGSVIKAIDAAGQSGVLHLSPISAWEIGRAAAGGTIGIATAPLDYFNSFAGKAGANLCVMGPDVLVASSFLPGNIHKDPMDRILIETARRNNLTLVTRDRKILAYGAEGHVKVMAC